MTRTAWAVATLTLALLAVAYAATSQAVHADLYGDGCEIDHG